MKDFKVLLVEDEILIAEDLKDILNSFGISNVYFAHTKTDAIVLLKEVKLDLVLLDIRLEKELDGLEIGEYINFYYKIPFMYITAHSDMAMIREIVKTKPAAYITKPFKKSDLFANINLIYTSIRDAKNKFLTIKDGYDSVVIPFEMINHIEGEGNYINIFTDNKKMVSRQSLDSVMEKLDTEIFFRVHRSFIINVSKVKRYSKKEVEINTFQIPVSRSIADDFETFIKDYRK